MNADQTLGRCPECAAAIEHRDVLVEYRRGGGERARFAECPGCDAVVHPENEDPRSRVR